jgi:hypothetical protein
MIMINNRLFLEALFRKIISPLKTFKHAPTLIIITFYFVLSLYITWPLAIHPATASVNGSEEQLISYIINWNIYALFNKPFDIYNAPFLHPIKNTLAFSDPLLSTSIFVSPFVIAFREPFLAYTLPTLFAFFANAFFTYLLLFEMTKNRFAALLAGLLFSFSIARIDTLEHLQVLSIYLLPLGLLFFFKYIKKQSKANAFGVSFCFAAQVLNTIFLGYVYIFSLAVFFLAALYSKKLTLQKSRLLLVYGILSTIFVALILSPYWSVSQVWNYTRSIKDAWGASAIWYEYFYPTNTSRLVDIARKIIHKSPWPAYLGLPISLLGLFSIAYYLKNLSVLRKNWQVLTSLIIAMIGFVLSLGPWFRLSRQIDTAIPLPYLILYYVVPGFKSMRVPQRWSHLLLFGSALFIGVVLSEFAKRYRLINLKIQKPYYGLIILLALVIAVMLEPKWPLMNTHIASAGEVPTIYQWLALQPSKVIIEIPAQHWTMPLVSNEIKRLHYRTFILDAEHSFVNGYSGFSPPTWSDSIFAVKKFPEAKSIETLRQLGVELVVVHFDEVQQLAEIQGETLDAQSLRKQIDENVFLELVHDTASSSVYLLKPEM